MKSSQPLRLGMYAALVVAILAPAAASAATRPSLLPTATATTPVTANTTSGTSRFATGLLELSSAKSTGLQNGNSVKLGFFVTTFNELKSVNLGVGCTGEKNVSGSDQVTVNGTFHIRDYKNGTTLATASILLLAPVHMSCSTISEVLSGCLAGALTPENVLTKTLTLTFATTGNDNTIITVLNEEGTANELCQLLAKEGTAATKLAAITSTQQVTGFKQEGAAVTVLVMPL